MMLVQIPIILGSTLPFAVFAEYIALSRAIIKSANRIAIEQVVLDVLILSTYTPFACSFFTCMASSKSLRNELNLFLVCRKTNVLGNNQILPNSTTFTINKNNRWIRTKELSTSI
ncbi:unnamed protein product [Rotaria magnacalcarata]|uniref:Uncharacterized protein n=1 Tax=Rotaria magnacalcarata TaxID=392030 RepID=A0A816F6A8_9BILA|nr:unnamed protein product [Rotaria magnacalcarata]